MSAPPTVTNSPTPPLTPDEGDLWFNVLTGRTYDWYIGPSGVGTWVETQPSGGALVTARSVPGIQPQLPTSTERDVIRVPEITVSPVPPVAPLVGDLWWSPITGMECIWYDDGNSVQWVQTQPVKYINLATLAGPAGGDLTGMYPNPQIIPGVVLDAPLLADPPDPALDDEHIVTAAWVNDKIAADLPTIPTTLPMRATVNAFLQRAVGGTIGVQLTSPIPGAYVGMIVLIELAGFQQITGITPGTDNGVYNLTNIGDAFNAAPTTPIPAGSSVTVVPIVGAGSGITVSGSMLTPVVALTSPYPTTLPPSGPAGGALAGTYPNPGLAVPYPTTLPGPPTGPAGGALGGTYPNPSLAVPYPTTLPPSGAAGGDLAGSYPNPTIKPSATNLQVMTTVAGVATWAAPSGGASISVGDTPPVSPTAGALWWNSVLGTLFIYYNDGNSTQWVPAAPSAQTATPPFPAPGVLTLYSEQKCVGGETQMNVAIPLNAKRVELEWVTQTGASPSHLLQVVESGVPNAAANYSEQVLYGNGSTAGASGTLSQTSWSISGGTYSAVSVKLMSLPGIWLGIVNQTLIQSSRYYQAFELDFPCNPALTTGFRITIGSSSFQAGSFFRAYVVV